MIVKSPFDVVVVGSGNAGASAALAARDAGASVAIIEKSPRTWAGGNSYFTAGAFRVAFDSLADLRTLVDIDDGLAERVDMPPYPAASFVNDLVRVTKGHTDPVLAQVLAKDSLDVARWLRTKGVRWELLFNRQAFHRGDRYQFWGNLVVGAVGGGVGLVASELKALACTGVSIEYERALVRLDVHGDHIALGLSGVGGNETWTAKAVVIASGGFEADPRRRAQYLGSGWDLAAVRGTPYNTGDGLMALLNAGAQAAGHWSGCHAIAWDAAAPAHGRRNVTNRYSRQGYPFGVVVNELGQRFIDEGADFRNYTYAKYGAEVMRQPSGRAFQIFDQQTVPLLSEVDYSTAGRSRYEASTMEELAQRFGIDPNELVRTVTAFNQSTTADPFDPTVRDGKRTRGVLPPKSNWAVPLVKPPFVAFEVKCGITFTFGGVAINSNAAVVQQSGKPFERVFACGELAGGLFYHNYPGGSGLTAGSVFGRRAGVAAARAAMTD